MTISLGFDKKEEMKYVKIFFVKSHTFARITKDKAEKFVDQLSAIGGTLGLLTGFSIISGIEILYFATKLVFKMFRKK